MGRPTGARRSATQYSSSTTAARGEGTMRSSFKEPCGVLWLALLAGSCVPVPVGVGVTVPIAPAPAPVVVTGPGFEMNANRPGADYRGFDIAPHPEICRNACLGEAPCAAFTYVAPGVQGPAARCWLKSAVPPLVPDACCVSGFKPAAPPPRRRRRHPHRRIRPIGSSRAGSRARAPTTEPSISRRQTRRCAARSATASHAARPSPTSTRTSWAPGPAARSRARRPRPCRTVAASRASSEVTSAPCLAPDR